MLTRVSVVLAAALVQIVMVLVGTDRTAEDWWSVVRGTVAIAVGVVIVAVVSSWTDRRRERS